MRRRSISAIVRAGSRCIAGVPLPRPSIALQAAPQIEGMAAADWELLFQEIQKEVADAPFAHHQAEILQLPAFT